MDRTESDRTEHNNTDRTEPFKWTVQNTTDRTELDRIGHNHTDRTEPFTGRPEHHRQSRIGQNNRMPEHNRTEQQNDRIDHN